METLSIHTFKESFGPIIELLNEHKVQYQMRQIRSGQIMNSSGVLEVILNPAMWGALATIVVMFIKSKHGRKVIITTKDNNVIQAEGLTKEELEKILKRAKNISAIDPNSPKNEAP